MKIYILNQLISVTKDELKKLFDNNELTINCDQDKIYFNLGVYYNIEKNYDEMKKYYLMAIDLGNSNAMNDLGLYYKKEKKYDEMKKYYLMAIDLGYYKAMNNLGNYYLEQQNYEEMKKYYLMAIDFGHSIAMYNLGHYYHFIEKNNEEAKKYYLMAIKLNYSYAIEKFKKITTPLERYILYQNNNIKFDEELTTDIKIFQNKIKNFKKNSNCAICMQDNLECIPLNWCLHFVCINCYPKLYDKPCPFCRL